LIETVELDVGHLKFVSRRYFN